MPMALEPPSALLFQVPQTSSFLSFLSGIPGKQIPVAEWVQDLGDINGHSVSQQSRLQRAGCLPCVATQGHIAHRGSGDAQESLRCVSQGQSVFS
jgi:hypothetical protein